ncbi:MAG: DNA translocase FtsK 4TM domain-containing protein [Proteobacteria bacterium]|nr:DNA translocase FtsK 4TM domain-containing protein [Pseudomonadota bacterium]MBU1640282.1 DNA translocase FtsK 4TM domain-containing protein [Pseudomonadota bacterium]
MATHDAKENLAGEFRPHFGLEIIAVLGLVVSLFFLLSLVSFSVPGSSNEIANWGGAVGQLLATALMSFVGFSSFWIPFLLILLSLSLFVPDAVVNRLPYIILGCTGLMVASSTMLAAIGLHEISLLDRVYPLGGYLGNKVYALTAAYFGGPGAVLFAFALFFLSFMVLLRFSPYLVSRWIVSSIRGIWIFWRARRIDHDEALQVTTEEKSRPRNNTRKRKEPPVDGPRIMPAVKEPISLTMDDDEREFEPLPVEPGEYQLPTLALLDKPSNEEVFVDKEHYLSVSMLLEAKLDEFGVRGKVTGISPGPVVTTYEFEPAAGVKINKVVNLADDLALVLKAESVRVVGSIPGKAALGIEIPNPIRKIVYVRDIMSTPRFQQARSMLTLGLGMDVIGNPVTADLARMPHLLIAGATGAGKSVAINTIICSILMRATPDEVRLLMVDPKRIELSSYEGIPHLLHPVVVDPKMASRALQWAVKEMERRYTLMEQERVKSFASYNDSAEEKLPLIVIIIDELADLMMVSSKDVEGSVARLAQMARAAGMHLILATQRPSVDVLTGLIKANFPTRMSFKVSSKIDSRTILDASGAEHLLGNGDMLFLPPGTARLQRIHGAYISEKETERIVEFLKSQGSATYDESMLKSVEDEPGISGLDGEDYDEKYDEAVAIVCESGQASISAVQRRLRIGYNRAARIIETMEREGIVGPADGAKPREVLARREYS